MKIKKKNLNLEIFLRHQVETKKVSCKENEKEVQLK